MTRFQNILLVDSPGVEQQQAIQRALSVAEGQQAAVTLLRVIDLPRLGVFSELFSTNPETVKQRLLAESRAELETAWQGQDMTIDVRVGTGFIEVVRAVITRDFDLVIKVADPRRIGDDRHLMRKCPCPVWLMRSDDSDYERIMAAVDFDPWSEDDESALNMKILETASQIALAQSAELILVHVWTPISDRMISVFASDLSSDDVAQNLDRERRERDAQLQSLTARLRDQLGEKGYGFLTPRFRLVQGDPAERIPVLARNDKIDLVVMGTLARTGVPGLIIGNTAETILGRLECAVLALKPDGFESPVKPEQK